MKRQNITTNAPWEKLVGYSRAVRTGKTVEVSGTVAIMDNEVVGLGDAYAQTRRILEIINEVSDFKKSLSDEKIGYFGDFSNIISYQTGLFSVTNVSGIDNVKMNSVFSFQTLLYNQSCETIEENKFDYIVTDKNATKINNLAEFELCNNYVIQEAYNYSEIFILKKK